MSWPISGEPSLQRGRGAAGARLRGGNDGGDPRLQHGGEERRLAGEVEVDGALGDPGLPGDVIQGGLVEAARTEDPEGGLENLTGPLVGPALPATGVRDGGCGGHGASGYLTSWLDDSPAGGECQ